MNDFYQEVAAATRRHGFNPVVGDIQLKQQQWYNWYRGDVNGFHLFTRNINGKQKRFERQTLNMPKKICEDYATLIWNDQCQISIKNERAEELVHEVLHRNNFETQFANLLESSFGMGMAYMVQYLAKNKTEIDFISFDNALPLGHNNGKVDAIVTINPFTIHEYKKEYQVTHLTYHYIEEGNYCILHEAYMSDNPHTLGTISPSKLKYVFSEEDLEQMRMVYRDDEGKPTEVVHKLIYETSHPFFQVIKPNINNHYEQNSPYGVPVISTLIPSFKVVDTLWDMLQSEAEDNRTRIVIDHQMFQTTMVEDEERGTFEFVRYFDETDTTFIGLPFKNTRTDQKAIEFLQGQLRFDQITLALNSSLQVLGFRAGLGKKYYSFQDGAVYQNEANVIHSNADTWKSKKKHEIIIEDAIRSLVKSILYLEKQLGNYSGDPETEEVIITFDDSIVQDDTSEFNTIKLLADDGYLPRWYPVAKGLKIGEDEAKRIVEEATAEDAQAALQFLGEQEPEEEQTEVEINSEA